jgi:hypothetical protein
MTDPDRYISRDPDAAWRVFQDGAVIVSPTESVMHSLNAVGTRIWELADGSLTVSEIADKLAEEFDVDHETASKDVSEFAETMSGKGMITIE